MYKLEYIESAGCSSEYLYHKNVIDYYLLFKDNRRIYSEDKYWSDHCLALKIDNLNKEVFLKKAFISNVSNSYYDCRISDCWTIRDDLFVYIEEVKAMLDILDYKIIIPK